MGTIDDVSPPSNLYHYDAASALHRVALPPPQPFTESLRNILKETFFPDDPLRQFKNQPPAKRLLLGLQYFFPIIGWGRHYTLQFFKSDLIAGITIASLAVPQGISYAKLGNLPPILGLYSSFVPPMVYAVMGSSRDLAVGTVAVSSMLISSILSQVVDVQNNQLLYIHLAFTSTFFAGILEVAMGLFRLGFIVDFLSHAAILGFMGGAATVVILQQLKTLLGLEHFTHKTDVIDVMQSIFTQTREWRWESAVVGSFFLSYLLLSRYLSKKKSSLFWVSAISPLTSVIVGSILVYVIHGEKHGIQVIGNLKKGINPPSIKYLNFESRYLPTVIKTALTTGIISMAEGMAVGRSFAQLKNYHIDGNKEMMAFGMMNIAGSFTSCYLTTGPFSRSAVNFNAGCQTAVSNIVMAIAVMATLLFLTPLFHYTPLVVLSAIIIAAMISIIDYPGVVHLWQVDKFDFVVCMAAFIGVVFGSIPIGLILAVGLSIMRILLFVARPRTVALGNLPDSELYRNLDHYQQAQSVPGVLILEIDAPIYFANSNYLRERLFRWIEDEEDKIKSSGEVGLQYIILDLSAVGNIDTSGISMLDEVKKIVERRGLKMAVVNPVAEVMKKLNKSKFVEGLGEEWMFLTVGEAVRACSYMLHTSKPQTNDETQNCANNV